MPIPEAPTSTPMQLALPTPSDVNDEEMQAPMGIQPPAMQRTNRWEEPHPGQRFSFPPLGNAGGVAGEHYHNVLGVYTRIGMAVKGYKPYPSRGRVPGPANYRRLQRPRIRQSSLRALRIPASINKINNNLGAPVRAPQSQSSSTAPMLTRPSSDILASTELAVPRLEVDPAYEETSESEGLDRPLSYAAKTVTSSELSSPRLSMTDFSNHLNIAFGAGDYEPGELKCLRTQEYQSDGPDEDPYGWEAELDRKLQCSTLEYHRAGGAKRSLLHRVFSLGPRNMP